MSLGDKDMLNLFNHLLPLSNEVVKERLRNLRKQYWQLMRPIYHTCMEKGIQHVATHAADATLGSPVSATPPPPQTKSRTINGKVKHS